ncbi:hypothetical protein AVEN_75025-1 [Araneus ventricosus]|uniref:Uncharacterized protein n=1 Tax=Araneus ventricosus TaxID=182803 RepID=A0A4Y2GRL2_ARAVE|nr:hypothetical protein AVEN_75025-1 [Araneus ventricosus]
MNIVFLHFLHGAPCLTADSPVSPAQIFLHLINGCEPVTLHLLPQRSIALCTCLSAESSPLTTVARNKTNLSHENCISLIVTSTSEINLHHASRRASCGTCSSNELRFPSTL